MILGLLLGALVGLTYVGATWLTFRLASGRSDAVFLKIYFSGMIVRLALALLLVGVVLLSTSVPEIAFLGAFFIVFVLGLVFEVLLLHRSQSR